MTAAHPHPTVHVFDHPLIQQKLTRIRRRETKTTDFRRNLNQIAGLMLFEISDDLPTREIEIQTPMETAIGLEVSVPLTIVPILRAGIGMTDGLLALIPEARVGHIGLYRDETSLKAVPYYAKFPKDMAQGPVLLVDPMLATGGSAIHAASVLKEHGCSDIRFICLVAAPEGVQAFAAIHPDVPIHTAALDRQLNDHGYILPGLGDAGDRIFGTQ